MKKAIALITTLALICTLAFTCGFAAGTPEEKMQFKADGTFKILMLNDWQDTDNYKQKTADFIAAVLDAEQPDLAIFAGDQLSDIYPFASEESFRGSLTALCSLFEEREIPFLVTMGNHDHDREATLDEAGQYAIYNSFKYCINTENGPENDPFTCYLPIYSSDGSKMVMNVYCVDTNNTDGVGSYTGVTKEQVEWYKAAGASLKEANGGEAVPSLLFQHVPVKEIYQLLRVCDWNEDGAIYSRRDGNWYVVDTENGVKGKCGEAPCSEDFDVETGEYQAWLENGDIMGAFFAHDHVNTFEGTTKDGIRMGYNGGSGFRSYGNGGDRSVRVFNINENDVTNYETHLVTYNEIFNTNQGRTITDWFSPELLTVLMKVVYALFGWAINLFK